MVDNLDHGNVDSDNGKCFERWMGFSKKEKTQKEESGSSEDKKK